MFIQEIASGVLLLCKHLDCGKPCLLVAVVLLERDDLLLDVDRDLGVRCHVVALASRLLASDLQTNCRVFSSLLPWIRDHRDNETLNKST